MKADQIHKGIEEEVRLLSNQRLRYYELRACAVDQIFHALYVVSGGGHTHLNKTEVSPASVLMMVTLRTLNCIESVFITMNRKQIGEVLLNLIHM